MRWFGGIVLSLLEMGGHTCSVRVKGSAEKGPSYGARAPPKQQIIIPSSMAKGKELASIALHINAMLPKRVTVAKKRAHK